MKNYIVYQTTNLLNNKIYIGLHATNDINDNYLGSGVFLKKAIKKYGYINFKKENLFIFDNKSDMIKKEKELVTEDFILRRDTYNMAKGGYGLSTLSNEKREKAIIKMKQTKKTQNLALIAEKRIKTMLANDPHCFSKIAAKSAETQRKNYNNGYINPRQTNNVINIYNEKDELLHTCLQVNFNRLCIDYNLPCRVLGLSFTKQGIPIYIIQQTTNKNFKQYKGWYALRNNDKQIDIREYLKTTRKKGVI